jgi:hypothetical protein
MFEPEYLNAEYGEADYGSAYGAATSGPVPIPPWVGSGGWSYRMANDGTVTVLSEPSGKYKGLTRTAADGAAYDAIVREATNYFGKQPIFLTAILQAVAQNRAKFTRAPTAPSTPTFAPLPLAPGAASAPAPEASPAAPFYSQVWFPPVAALGVLAVVGLGVWFATSRGRK